MRGAPLPEDLPRKLALDDALMVPLSELEYKVRRKTCNPRP